MVAAGSSAENGLSAFNAEADALVHVGADNRIALWDVASGALKHAHHEKDHLTQQYTCVAFQCAGDKRLVATGNAKGQINVWDMNTGTRIMSNVQVPDASAAEAVADVCFSKDAERLFACSSQGRYVHEFLLEDDEHSVARKFKVGKQGCVKICISDDDSHMLTASTSIKLWDLASGARVQRFAGHPTPVRALAFAPDSSCFVSCCEDRVVSLWPIDAPKKTRGKTPKKSKKRASLGADETEDESGTAPMVREPASTFALASPPIQLALAGKKKNVLLAACSEDGRVSLCRASISSGSEAQAHATPDNEILVPAGATGRTVQLGLLAAAGDLVLARETSLRPVFERLKIDELPAKKTLGDASSNARLLQTGGALISSSDDEDDDVDMADAANGAAKEKSAAKEKLHVVKDSKTGLAKPQAMQTEDDNEGNDEDGGDEDDAGSTDDERTLGERVRELTAALQKRVQQPDAKAEGRAAAAADDDGDEEADTDNEGDSSKRRKRPRAQPGTAGSLSTVLEQALQSNDNQLLEVCLRNQDKKVIGATVQRLSPRRAVQLLGVVVSKLEARPARGQALLLWIHAVLEQHATHMVKIQDLPEVLGSLYQVIETRLAVFDKFLKLSGRLDFVLSQVALRTAQEADDEDAAADRAAPSIVYDEEAPEEPSEPAKKKKKKKRTAA
ncbi:Guanine nucleotide-binding protein subunit beta-1 [Hondaea fermentalgiana]|uniref:Guanine nucleotide-binding protein subunit beta-1 n=1 Tax=Hondaea fermentalgiana TaxID=2315210 RepID=A0A2R5GH87_9STRA|nr:Guanine nucleotide-binding protein subunit beta-1 [Hondaea fermentalgiana]|eukprot:GBG29108.1 Guanine nucleotide-binding protein subunit beta-1 [Hondaea fermentalgiana]